MSSGERDPVEIAEALGYRPSIRSKRSPYTLFLRHESLGVFVAGKGRTLKAALRRASEAAIEQFSGSMKATASVLPRPSPKETGGG